MKSFFADFRLAVLLLVRSRLWLVGGILVFLVAAFAGLSAQFSPRQPATVALDVGLSVIRLIVPFLAMFQIQDLIAREVERRLMLTSLTYPRSRTSFITARYAAVMFVSIILMIALASVLAVVVTYAGKIYGQATPVGLGLPYVITLFYVLLDIAVVLAFATALATVSTTPNLVVLGSVGFMVAARSASAIVTLLEREKELLSGAKWYHLGLQSVQWFLPDLAALDVRSIALYNKMEFMPHAPWALVLMAGGYVTLLLTLGCKRFERRQFV